MSKMTFHAPSSLDEALSLLAGGEGVHCLSGGASLVPMMNAGLIEPAGLVSLERIDELKGIRALPDGGFRIGAFTQHRVTAAETRLVASHAALRECAATIGSPAIRNSGTIGGSVALSDPAANYPAALVALGVEIEVASTDNRRRRIPAADFFVDWYTTALGEGEIITGFLVPAAIDHAVGFYEKLARVEGDFATVAVAGVVRVDAHGVCDCIRLAIGACGPVPGVSPEAERLLLGSTLDDAILAEAAALIADRCDPVDDVRGSAAYRLKVIPVLVRRGVRRALAKGGSRHER